ncbi:MAG: hypothetical protein HUU43_00090 [Ignavibacteriaceae bacterium]|nr:hypothetical protein [Ignavibacteriaceae bacterium]NUM69216.1 hypothetical protein [Ignavibacteriaceae bacterium]
MIKEIRRKYNSEFSYEKYNAFVDDLNNTLNSKIEFRVCETPLFLSRELTSELKKACGEIIDQISTKEYMEFSKSGIPSHLKVPGDTSHPVFLQIDFAICNDENGGFTPRLIELQGFPSLYGFQAYFQEIYQKHFHLPEGFTAYYNGLNLESYKKLLYNTIVGDTDPEETVLLEIYPYQQKTLIDFLATEHYTGITPVCLTEVKKRGNKLFYSKNGKEIQIRRIYNRVIQDELERSGVEFGFSFADELDVQWVGHPDWFFRISKYTLPRLKTKYSPEAYFLHEIDKYPEDLHNYVLKPLYSFAGLGVEIDVTKESLDSKQNKENYILQKKIEYAPLVETPDIPSKVEIRMMFLWNDKPMLVNNLTRFSKGKMMGVDFNKNKTWVGSNTAFHPED